MTLIVCAPLCLYLATGSFGYVGWLEILVHIIGWFGFLQCLFFIWYLCMRYFDLCIKRKPAVVAKKDELLVYLPFARHYLHIDWNDISDFQAERAKGCSFFYPLYKNADDYRIPAFFPHRHSGFRIDAVRTKYLEVDKYQLIGILKQYL